MSDWTILGYAVIAAATGLTVFAGVRWFWLALGAYRIHQAGPRPLSATRHTIWRDPGAVEQLNVIDGPGGADSAPAPPFRFLEEHLTGSQPCVSVRDARNRRWRVKWGSEVRAENFAVRLVWACGYYAEATYFVASGSIQGAAGLRRAHECVAGDGTFREARFELDEPSVRKLFEEHSWAWNDNPFLGTPQLHGLKVLVMLLADWDTKDRRDVARGSNTAIFEYPAGRWRREARYLITDWGGSMGRWGSNVVTRGRWDPEGFAAQTPEFVTGVDAEMVRFGYVGQRTADVATGISVQDVRWLCRFLCRITDEQLRAALTASGATESETDRFTHAIRDRIAQLHEAGSSQVASPLPQAATELR
ncbi:MAG TPA: hypothetical protein VFZ73_13325 [Gemmatimonadaceae bacterium]